MPRYERLEWEASKILRGMEGGSLSVNLVPLDEAYLEQSLRPLTAAIEPMAQKANKRKIEKVSKDLEEIATYDIRSLEENGSSLKAIPSSPKMSPRSPPSISSKDIRSNQIAKLRRKAETINSNFLTQMMPSLTHLPSQSEAIIAVRMKPSPSEVEKVRKQRAKLVNERKPGWGKASLTLGKRRKEAANSLKSRKRLERADQAVLQRAKLAMEREEKATKINIEREMKMIRGAERKNMMEKARRWMGLVSVTLATFSLRQAIAHGQFEKSKSSSAQKIQALARGRIHRRRDKQARHLRLILGPQKSKQVLNNLRARVKKSAAKCLTAFVLAIPVSTKAFVALRLFRANVIRVQRWWRSFLECKLIRMRCLIKFWALMENSNKTEIKETIRKQGLRGIRRSLSMATLGKERVDESTDNKKRKISKYVNQIATECVKELKGSNANTHTGKKLRHSRSVDALGLNDLLVDLKPALASTCGQISHKAMMQNAQKMLFKIDETRRNQKLTKRSPGRCLDKGGTVERRRRRRRKPQKNRWSQNWDTWLHKLQRWNDSDEGSGIVPRSSVPFRARVAAVKSTLEKSRLSYVKRSLNAQGKSIDYSGHTIHRQLVSIHTMKHVISGKLSVPELYNRNAHPMFTLYTSQELSERNFIKLIVDTKLSFTQ